MSLENKFKQKLESRRIEPTASAWDRIEGKLEVAQGKKKSKVVLWVAIAASFIAGVFLTAVLFDGGQNNSTDVIVNAPSDQETPQENNDFLVKSSLEMLEVEDGNIVKNESATTKEDVPLQNPPLINRTQSIRERIVKQPYTSEIVNTTQQEVVQIQVPSQLLGVKTIVIDEKEAIASAEADALLKDAQRDIISEDLFNKNSNRVDANALLLDVEAEVDPDTFKDKIFKSLKTGFDKAVEAVASKNN